MFGVVTKQAPRKKEKEDTVTELSEEELNALIDAKVEERLKEASEKKGSQS